VTSITTDPLLLFNLATELLHDAEQALLDNNLYLPEHRFVSYNAPAWDCCDHLVAHVGPMRPAKMTKKTRVTAAKSSGNINIAEADIFLTYIGCAAIGDPIPSDEVIQENAENIYQPMWVLFQELMCNFTASALESTFGKGCHVIDIIQLAPHPPMGGCESFVFQITVQFS